MHSLNTSFSQHTDYPDCKIKYFNKHNEEKIQKKLEDITRIQCSIDWKPSDLSIATRRMHIHEDPKYFLKKGNTIIGYAILTTTAPLTWYLSQIAIDLEYQSQGYGKKLMNHIFKEAINNSISTIDLKSDNQQVQMKFYKPLARGNISIEISELYVRYNLNV